MAQPQRITYLKVALEDKPGALLAVTKELKSKNLGLVGLWGYATQPGQGELYLIPKKPEKFQKMENTSPISRLVSGIPNGETTAVGKPNPSGLLTSKIIR